MSFSRRFLTFSKDFLPNQVTHHLPSLPLFIAWISLSFRGVMRLWSWIDVRSVVQDTPAMKEPPPIGISGASCFINYFLLLLFFIIILPTHFNFSFHLVDLFTVLWSDSIVELDYVKAVRNTPATKEPPPHWRSGTLCCILFIYVIIS